MEKLILFFILILPLSLSGCGIANDKAAHGDGNLIVTNYSDCEITDVAITHAGETIAISPEAVKDTQICRFTIESAQHYKYAVSFVDHNGEWHSQEFTDQFTEDGQILIAIRYAGDSWTIDYDK